MGGSRHCIYTLLLCNFDQKTSPPSFFKRQFAGNLQGFFQYFKYVILLTFCLQSLLYVVVLQPVKAWQVHFGFKQMEENVQSCGDA